ncbi:MAG: hypothetical protein OEU54_03380 [Gemmatimonadota bacterium]|nr:hypothetical protein [Gemmatimonadota bacterium]
MKTTVLLATAALVTIASAVAAQAVPTIPAGVPAVFLPVQETRPTAGGAWLAGSVTDDEAIALLDAELAFAFGEERGADSWAMPEDVKARLERNPMLKVNATQLAYHGLLAPPRDDILQIYEPLHTQLRQIAALFDARIVVLPLASYYVPPTEEEKEAALEAGSEEPLMGHAVLLTAVIDIRRSAVLWHGAIPGGRAEATSRAVLTTLAIEAAKWLAPS